MTHYWDSVGYAMSTPDRKLLYNEKRIDHSMQVGGGGEVPHGFKVCGGRGQPLPPRFLRRRHCADAMPFHALCCVFVRAMLCPVEISDSDVSSSITMPLS